MAICELPYSYVSSEEAGGVGGTCVLRGCVPKKLMVYGSEYASAFKDSEGFGWQLSSPQHDWKTLLNNKRKELDRLNGVYLRLLEGSGVDLHEGRGALVNAHTVRVNDQTFTVHPHFHYKVHTELLGTVCCGSHRWSCTEIENSWC